MDYLNNQENNSVYISPNSLDKQIKTIFKKLEKKALDVLIVD